MDFKSLIYSRKRRGARTEPWGTPRYGQTVRLCVIDI